MKQVNTVMREAFENIQVRNVAKNASSTVKNIISSLNRSVGLVRSDVWNANLSFKTFRDLKGHEGWAFTRQPEMAYDKMVRE